MANEQLQELIQQAAEIAKSVPESMQEAAFHRALDELLQGEGQAPSPRLRQPAPARRPSGGDESSQSDRDHRNKLGQINRTAHPEVTASSSLLDRCLMVVRVAKNDLNIDGLTAPEVAAVLTDQFRVATKRQHVARALDDATRFVERKKVGQRRVIYRIMGPGEDHLDAPGEGQAEATRRTSRRRRGSRKAVGPTKSKTTKKAATRGTGTKRTSGRKGPKAAIQVLLDSGYFTEPRTIGQIQNRLEVKLGHTYKLEDLSPSLGRLLREGKLDREKNEQGQYEYSAE
jgi:hypothetical protein